MLRYLTENPHPEDLFPEEACEQFLERGRCLLQLLSKRRVLRLVCAPAAYGKTALAFQYAHLAFGLKNVAWVNASDFLFLCDLEARALPERLSKYCHNSLVVFDDVPVLHEERAESFDALVDVLLGRRCEVLALTEHPPLADAWDGRALVLRGLDLALDENELAEGGTPCASGFEGRSLLPACACLGGREGQERFFRALAAPGERCAEERVALSALVLGSGTITDIEALCGPLEPAALRQVSTNFPYVSISARAGRFMAAPLGSARRARLVELHGEALAQASPFSTEAAFVEALEGRLVQAGDRQTALEIAACFEGHPATERASAASAHIHQGPNGEVPERALRPRRTAAGDVPTMRWSSMRLAEGCRPDERLSEGFHGKIDEAPFEVVLFGRFSITRAGEPVPPVGEVRNMGKLLIALILANHNRELPRKWVQNALWPNTCESAARSSYYNLWNYVRRLFVVDEEAFARQPRSQAYASLSPLNIRSDVQAFDALRTRAQSCRGLHDWERLLDAAIRLYRGPLLPGIDNAELESCRSAYANKMIDLLLGGIDAAVRAGQLGVALRFATRAFELDPTREDVCYRYMDIQKRLGQLAGAVSTFLGCRRALVDRFGLEGSSRLEALYREILHEMG